MLEQINKKLDGGVVKTQLTEERIAYSKITTEETKFFDVAHEFVQPAIETDLPFEDPGHT